VATFSLSACRGHHVTAKGEFTELHNFDFERTSVGLGKKNDCSGEG
jgi:hypothetical protein